jgi:hypothetical protein
MYQPEEIKARIDFPQLMSHYGYKINHARKICCPFHKEDTPSFHVYDNGGHCYGGCGWTGDIIQFVIDRESAYFTKALELLAQWFGIAERKPGEVYIPATKVKDVPKKIRREPVNPELIEFFHSQLTTARRLWLKEARLLNDQTIDYLKIGWRPDMDAYSIPFWKGVPGMSEVDILQFRFAPKEGRKSRYISLDNHGFAGLIGRHTMNSEFLVFFVGTLDCVLAGQDGIPAVSPNGLTVWSKRLDELKWIIGDIKELYFVPDNTRSETIESMRLANALGAKIRYLPEMESGKDYTDFRLAHTAEQFIEEVLQVSKSPFIENTAHAQTVKDILEYVSLGQGEKAIELLVILEETGYKWWSVSHKMQCVASSYPFEVTTASEWQDLIRQLELAHSYSTMAVVLLQTAESWSLAKGNF